MPAVSKAQQKFMGMVHAADKGETPASPEVAKVSKDMDDKSAKDFASTSHKGLPDKIKEMVLSELRSVRAIQTDYAKVLDAMEKHLTAYKQSKGTPSEKQHIQQLKTLTAQKKKLSAELDARVSGLYKDAELKVDEMTGSDAAGPYNTPFAFGKPESEKTKGKRQADLTGYSVVGESFTKGVTYGGTACKGGCYMGKEGLKKIIKISKESPNNVFMFRQDNTSGLQPHFIKNGIIGKATTLNPSYDLDRNKVRNLNIGKDVILAVRLYEVMNEASTSFISGNSGRTTTHLDNTKYQLTKDVKGAQIGNYTNVVLPKGSIIHNLPGGVFVSHPSLKDKFSDIREIPKFGLSIKRHPNTLTAIEKSSKILESVNENRWLDLKKDESSAQSKIGKGISNINKQLAEMERFLNWYGKIKNESGVTNKSYWKRTNSNIYSIKERLLKLDQKIRQISE
jgi:hypothetical protein